MKTNILLAAILFSPAMALAQELSTLPTNVEGHKISWSENAPHFRYWSIEKKDSFQFTDNPSIASFDGKKTEIVQSGYNESYRAPENVLRAMIMKNVRKLPANVQSKLGQLQLHNVIVDANGQIKYADVEWIGLGSESYTMGKGDKANKYSNSISDSKEMTIAHKMLYPKLLEYTDQALNPGKVAFVNYNDLAASSFNTISLMLKVSDDEMQKLEKTHITK